MAFNVFFAWQMDTATKLNRWFIETAIKTAIKKLRAEGRQQPDDELKLEPAQPVELDEPDETNPEADPSDADIVYQWGAVGHVGASMIAETILERIKACGVFIADLSFTTTVTTADERTKRVPNANVLIEVGAASQTGDGWDRTILIMNTALGPVDDLPFDLRHRQCQVKYTLADWSDPDRPKKAKRLAEDIALVLKPMYESAMQQAAEARRKAEKAIRAEIEAKRAGADQVRHEFEQDVQGQRFHGLRGVHGLLALSVIPLGENHIELTTDKEEQLRQVATAFPNYSGRPRYQTHSILTKYPDDDNRPAARITELTEKGAIFCAANLLYGHDGGVKSAFHEDINFARTWPMPFWEEQVDIVRAVQRYVNGLRTLGVKDALSVGFSVLMMKNCQLVPTNSASHKAMAFGKPCAVESMTTDSVIFEDQSELSFEQVTDILTRPIRQLWRYCQYAQYPRYTEQHHCKMQD